MAWKECNYMSQRKEFIAFTQSEDRNMVQLCQRYGISRKTGYKWIFRFQEQGHAGLQDHSRRPLNSPYRTDTAMEQRILDVRAKHPWCGRKIHNFLKNNGVKQVPAASTITQILHRHGCISEHKSEQSKRWIRFERPEPNDLWQADFKGDFSMSSGRCHPLTVLDDHSRFCICLQACADQKRDTVKRAFIETFRQYGLPCQMNFDNGPPWGTEWALTGLTRLTIWLIRQGIHVTYSAPMHPQTNGKDERFHRTLKAEVLQGQFFRNLLCAQQAFDQWRPMYNFERPHDALDNHPPAIRYRQSPRSYNDILEPIEYAAGDYIRTVNENGTISFEGKRIRITKALKGEPVAIRPTNKDGVFDVYYVRQHMKRINLAAKESEG